MTPKEREAMQQALDAIGDCSPNKALVHAAYALREALDHSGEANEMVIGWDRVKPEAIASDPLYQQGFVDGVEEGRRQIIEQTEQQPVGMVIGGVFEPWNDDILSGAHELYAAPISIEAAVLAERELCAKVCEEIAVKEWNAYKGRTEPLDKDKLYNPHIEGISDGADECAAAIRARSEK